MLHSFIIQPLRGASVPVLGGFNGSFQSAPPADNFMSGHDISLYCEQSRVSSSLQITPPNKSSVVKKKEKDPSIRDTSHFNHALVYSFDSERVCFHFLCCLLVCLFCFAKAALFDAKTFERKSAPFDASLIQEAGAAQGSRPPWRTYDTLSELRL